MLLVKGGLQRRSHQQLRQLWHDHGIGVGIFVSIGKVGERPGRRGSVEKPLAGQGQRVCDVLDQVTVIGDEAVGCRVVGLGGSDTREIDNVVRGIDATES